MRMDKILKIKILPHFWTKNNIFKQNRKKQRKNYLKLIVKLLIQKNQQKIFTKYNKTKAIFKILIIMLIKIFYMKKVGQNNQAEYHANVILKNMFLNFTKKLLKVI